MLRELSDQSVLASMRDTELSGPQSQAAAEGLARALMEAGYAQVQVVVNGQKPSTTAGAVATRAGSGAAKSLRPQDPDTKELTHGH